VSDLRIRAVLDVTALTAYGLGNLAVGEIIAELTDEGVGFAIPDVFGGGDAPFVIEI
jgi:hypothetical protein